MEISSMADWQRPLLAFHRLDQAFENDKCRNSNTDFQRDGTFPLVSSKLNLTRRRKNAKKVTRCLVEQDRRRIGNKEIVNENLPVPKRDLNCCGTATPWLASFLKSRVVDHV